MRAPLRQNSRPLRDPAPGQDSTLEQVISGLKQTPKRLPCKLFYDDLGSELFERICELPEYYLTRTELGILRERAGELAALLGPGCVLLEFGSGASVKTRVVLDALQAPRMYVPVDISPAALDASVVALRKEYPGLPIRPVCADYTRPLDLPLSDGDRAAKLALFFPGSTIGNLDPAEALAFLARIRREFGKHQRFVIGADLVKDRATLEAAYNDAQGITAEFNLNLLRALNRDYASHFELSAFSHRAIWNQQESRIEMQLISRRAQSVRVGASLLEFDASEVIVTEHCYKYSLEGFEELARCAGFSVLRAWTDARQLFSVQLLSPSA